MSATKRVVEEIEELLSNDNYEEALKVVNQKAIALTETLPLFSFHKRLLLLIARVYCLKGKHKEFNQYLSRYESLYSDSENNIDYIILKYYKFTLDGNTRKAIDLLKLSLKEEWTTGENIKLTFYLGKAHFWNGEYFEATKCFQRSHSYYLVNTDHNMLGHTLYMMGYVAFQRSFFDTAKVYFDKALKNFSKVSKTWQLGMTYKMLCVLDYRTGRYCEAKENLELAEEYFKECSNKSNIINCEITRARIAIFEGEYSEAQKILLVAFDEAEDIGFKRGKALSAEFLGEVYCRRENYEKSFFYLKEALTLALEIAPRGDIPGEVYRRLGDLYLALGRIEESEKMLSKGLRLCNHLGDKYELGAVYRAMGLVAIKKNDIDLAKSFFNEAIVTLKLIKESFELAATYVTAAEEYIKWSRRKDTEEGLKGELLGEARSFAVEATHLYSLIKLNDRVLYCERLAENIDKISGKDKEKVPSVNLSFNPEWLYGDNLVARSGEMKKVISNVKQLAKTEISILITGETGTGKEVVARYIHKMSDRAKGPFVAVNCASIPDSLFESELFGHMGGSFTGAKSDKKGLMEEADGGTLFLDEVSRLSDRQQAKLLRALEERVIRRVGEVKERYIDIRIISASNENVSELILTKRFREDLYYRIAAENIKIKPLRERKRDIEALFSYYLHNQSNDGYRVGEGVLRMLNKHHWPGNVRELVNLTHVLSSKGNENKIIFTDDFPLDIRDSSSSELDKSSITKNLRGKVLLTSINQNPEETRRLISSILNKHNGNKAAAARELKISRMTLYRYLKKFDLSVS